MRGLIHDYGTRVAYALVTLAAFFALTTAFVAIGRVSGESNRTRCEIVALVIALSQNTQRVANATIASPTATDAQKLAAANNLASVKAALEQTRIQLHHPHGEGCTG